MDRRRTVLVVDDNVEERKIFSAYLEFVGFRVLTAADGGEGLRLAREEMPSMILLDLAMPVLDGWSTIARLRESPATAWIPVVAVTAATVDELALRRAGFCGYVGKPMAPFQLLQEVERCMGWKSSVQPQAPRVAQRPGRDRMHAAEAAPRFGGGTGSD
jgi:two-component system, cell cycle response regulator DivK